MAALAAAVAEDPGARLPGAGRVAADPVEVAPEVWDLMGELAG
jgi:hypothetical protein